MGSDEKYLDDLLKSVSGDSGERKAMTEEDITALFSGAEADKADAPQVEPNIDTLLDDLLALNDTASDFDADFALDDTVQLAELDFVLDDTVQQAESDLALDDTAQIGEPDFAFDETMQEDEASDEYDFVLDELASEQSVEESAEASAEETVETVNAMSDGLLNEEDIQALMQRDAELFGDLEDQSDLVDLENLDIDEELGTDLLENIPMEIEEVPDTEEIEQGDMLDIASMFDSDEDFTEGITYDTSGFYDDEPKEEEFNPFADMSDIDDLLKAVNWGAKEEDSQPEGTDTDRASVEETTEEFALQESFDADGFGEFAFEEGEGGLEEAGADVQADSLTGDIDLNALDSSEDADMAELGALLKIADGEGSALDLLDNIPDDGPTGVAILHGDAETPKERKARLKAEKEAAKARKKAEKAVKKALKEVEDMPEPKYKKVAATETKDKEEKSGFFSRILNALLEEEEEEQPKKKPTEEIIELDENGTIPEDVDKETKIKEKPKKEKKEKEKKEKPKKEKKEKPKKEKVIDLEPPAKIRKASIKIVLGFAASFLVLVLFANAILEPMLSKHNAKKAFQEQQYEECYQLLAGQELSEVEQQMLDHASVVLKIKRRVIKYDEYINYKDRLNALDTLFDAVLHYDEWYQEALNCGARPEVEDVYAQILSLLDGYGVSEAQAKRIALLDDVTYTRVVTALAEGESYEEYFMNGTEQGEITDLLPGEMD